MRKGLAAIGLMTLVAVQPPAHAHPHVFVDVDMELEVAEDGDLRAIRYDWMFDDMYSAFAMQGLPRTNGAPTETALAKVADWITSRRQRRRGTICRRQARSRPTQPLMTDGCA